MRMVTLLLIAVLLGGCTTNQTWINKNNLDLKSLCLQMMDEFNIPALAVSVFTGQEILALEIHGTVNLETGAPLPADPIFHLGSVSKTISGFIAGQLVNEGLLSWDTRLLGLFPQFRSTARPEYFNITLREILSHRAGFHHKTDWSDFTVPDGKSSEQRAAFTEWALSLAPERSFPARYNYSNAGTVIAASMLERAAGLDYESLVQKYLNKRYHLEAWTGWPVNFGNEQPRGHMPGTYLGKNTDNLIIFDKEYVNDFDSFFGPAGDYCMRVSDFIRYIQVHLNGLAGKDAYMDKKSFTYLHFGLEDYSLCWENSKKFGYLISEHSGSKGNFFSHAVLFPELGIGMIIMANSGIVNVYRVLEAAAGQFKLYGAIKCMLDLYLNDSL